MPEFVQFCAVPTIDWQTPNHTTEMAEHSSTFSDMVTAQITDSKAAKFSLTCRRPIQVSLTDVPPL